MQLRQPLAELAVVLFREDLSGGHQGPLAAGINGREQRGDGHHGFATADIALHQTGHGLIAAEVRTDFRQDTLLGPRQGKGQELEEGLQQRVTLHRQRGGRAIGQLAAPLQQPELQQEELVKDQAMAGRTQALLVAGAVDLEQGIRQRHQSFTGLDRRRQGIPPMARGRHHGAHQVAKPVGR